MTENKHKAACLTDRAVLRISGDDTVSFLNNLFTIDIDPVRTRFGALLSSQGKILFDFIISKGGNDFYYLDCALSVADQLIKRLNFYKLRARIDITDISDKFRVHVTWGHNLACDVRFSDPRLADLGHRIITPFEHTVSGHAVHCDDYKAHRIALGVPESGKDFSFGDAFPHEVLMDQLNGIDFRKGCYIGQEVVSRVQHRRMARTRMMQAVLQLPHNFQVPVPLLADGKPTGELRTVSGLHGLALVRLDRLSEAVAAGHPVTAENYVIKLKKPDFAQFEFPVSEKSI